MVWACEKPLRVTEIHPTTIMHWIWEAGMHSPDAPSEEIPEITDLDELQTNVCNKRHKLWIWTAVNHKQAGILAWVIGDRSSATFRSLWAIVKCCQCFFDVTDGWSVYTMLIEDADRLVCKTYMTRVEGENTRLRLTLAQLHRQTLCIGSLPSTQLPYRAQCLDAPRLPLFCSLIHPAITASSIQKLKLPRCLSAAS